MQRKTGNSAGTARSALITIVLAGFPLSLSSPGATISIAIASLFGLSLVYRGDTLDRDLRLAFRYMLFCYLLLVGTDLLNGGSTSNVETAFNYLPLLALPLYAHAVRRLEITRQQLVLALQFTLVLALGLSAFRAFVLGEDRPGGLNLVSIGYGLVVSIWVVLLFSIALDRSRDRRRNLSIAAAGVIPVLLTESKIDMGALVTGATVVAVLWAYSSGRWRIVARGAIAVAVPLGLGVYFFMYGRLVAMQAEIAAFMQDGLSQGTSLGQRFELIVSGLRAFLDSPILGYGFAERMHYVFENPTPGGPDITSLSYVHNDYVTHMVAYGVFGLVFLAAYYFFSARLISRTSDGALRRGGFALLAMLAIYMVAEIVFNMDPVSGAVTMAIGMILALGDRTEGSTARR